MKEDTLIVKIKRPMGDDGYKIFSVRLRKDIVDRIDAIVAFRAKCKNFSHKIPKLLFFKNSKGHSKGFYSL